MTKNQRYNITITVFSIFFFLHHESAGRETTKNQMYNDTTLKSTFIVTTQWPQPQGGPTGIRKIHKDENEVLAYLLL